MRCPYCREDDDKVVDSRESKEGEVIRRRRECLGCGKRFTSYERIDEIPYMVVKKDGTRTLKDSINEAFRDWVTNMDSTHYVLGTACGACISCG